MLGSRFGKAKAFPSVVINELLDSLDKLVDFGEAHGKERKARDELVTVQTLHPFGWENFTGGKIPRSYSFGNLQAASALLSPEKETQPFLSGQMSEPPEKIDELTMNELIHFFQNPAKAFLKRRLGMSLWDEDSPPEECEPFELGSLEKYAIKNVCSVLPWNWKMGSIFSDWKEQRKLTS